MSKGRCLTCFWPGLAELWLAGTWSGLCQAVAFGVLLNGSLAATLVWTGLLSDELRFACWTGVASYWLIGIWSALRTLARREPDGDLFSSALSEYLQGNWFAAEALLEQLVKIDARDIEAQLFLATMFRRTGRQQEARAALDRLSRAQGGEKWELEIKRERSLLDRPPAEAATPLPAAAEPIPTSRAA
jgi:hypothetical protein